MRMQMEENHALRVELLHARDLLGAERASAEQSKWRLEATQAAALAARGGAAAGRHSARRLGEAAPHRAASPVDAVDALYYRLRSPGRIGTISGSPDISTTCFPR